MQPTDKLSPRALELLETLERALGADPAERSEQSLAWRLDNAQAFGRKRSATDRAVRIPLERLEAVLAGKPEPKLDSETKPSRSQLSALAKLEDALGWNARRKRYGAPRDLEAFRERASTARSSAGLGLMIAPDFQARAIREALESLKLAKPPRR